VAKADRGASSATAPPPRSAGAAAKRGRETATALEAQPLRALLEVLGGHAPCAGGVPAVAAVGPDPNDPILVALVDHEEALRAFGERSFRSDTEVLDPVEAVIRPLGPLRQ
jgi:hypothetical protein